MDSLCRDFSFPHCVWSHRDKELRKQCFALQYLSMPIGILPEPGNKCSSCFLTHLHSDGSIMCWTTTKYVSIRRHRSVPTINCSSNTYNILISYDDYSQYCLLPSSPSSSEHLVTPHWWSRSKWDSVTLTLEDCN